MLAGCLGLFIVIVIIGAIGSYFGEVWAGVAFIVLVGLGIWADREEKKKQQKESQNPNELLNNTPPIIPKTEPIKAPRTRANKETIQFWYTDYEGNLTYRNVDVKKLNGEYLEAYCHDREDTRTFRIERIDDEIIDLSTGEVLTKSQWLSNHGIYTVVKSRQKQNIGFDDDEIFDEICFTGFQKADREHLETLAIINNYIVRKSITKNLNYLVCGPNAGLAKIVKAEQNFVTILSKEEFLEMIGEEV